MRSIITKSILKLSYQQNIKSFVVLASFRNAYYRPYSISAHLRGKMDFNHLKASSNMLPISMGESYHEDEKLLATVKLLNTRFSKTKLVLADRLQRHDIDESDPVVYKEKENELIKKGDEWLKKNKAALDQINNLEIKRWNDYLTHHAYKDKEKKIDEWYENDSSFQKAVQNSASQFLKRKYNLNIKNFDEKTNPKAKSTINYIKEECAVYLLWFDIEDCPYLLYPNKLNTAMYNLIQRVTSKLDKQLLKPLVIDFKEDKKKINDDEKKILDLKKEIYLEKDVLERFCKKYLNACISTYHEIDSPEESNKFLIKTLLGLGTFIDEVKIGERPSQEDNCDYFIDKHNVGVCGDAPKNKPRGSNQ